MGKYKCNDDTLFHSVLFNLPKLESIMKHGLVSEKYANTNGIYYARNYSGYNLDDTISMIRYLYVNYNVEDSSYYRYVKNGVSLIIEDTAFISDKDERIIHRTDEVLVESHIPKEKIVGIMIPSEYDDFYLSDLLLIDPNMQNYDNAKNNCNYLVRYLISNNHQIDTEYYKFLMGNLNETNIAIGKQKKDSTLEKIDYDELILDFKDILLDINTFLAKDFEDYFGTLLNKDRVTLKEAVSYLNDKYLHVGIYNIPSDNLTKQK